MEHLDPYKWHNQSHALIHKFKFTFEIYTYCSVLARSWFLTRNLFKGRVHKEIHIIKKPREAMPMLSKYLKWLLNIINGKGNIVTTKGTL